MKIESDKRAIMILAMLVATAVVVFFIEKKLLIKESRGSTLSHYGSVKGVDDILFLIEDFEGINCSDSTCIPDSTLKINGFWTFGSAKASINRSVIDLDPMSSKSALMIEWNGTDQYGGWGKGVGANILLDPQTDFVNFRAYFPEGPMGKERIKILLAEDDNENSVLEEDQDDSWSGLVTVTQKNAWQMISIPLKDFADANTGGDGEMNITRRGGLHTITFVLDQPNDYAQGQRWYLDFINISHGTLNHVNSTNN